MIGTISLPDAQALRETDLDPSLDPWAEIERLKPLEKMLEVSPPARALNQCPHHPLPSLHTFHPGRSAAPA